MNRVNQILRHPLFQQTLKQIEAAEESRIYCGHGLEHLLSVARVATILAADEGIKLPRSMIYAAALLHDLGRAMEYTGGLPHQEGSLQLAGPILKDCGYDLWEQEEILTAILQHRSAWQGERTELGKLLYRADKESRPCFFCSAADTCNWPQTKRNLSLAQ